jgi:sugar phosphate isomerase/epimerase
MHLPLARALELLSGHTRTVEVLADANHDLLLERECCCSFDLHFTVHAPTTDVNIASCHEDMREASITLLDRVCAAAAGIGATLIVVHPGLCPWPQLHDRSCRMLLRSLRDLGKMQEEHGITVAVENLGCWEMVHFRDPRFLCRLEEHSLPYVLDIGHAHLNGNLFAFLDSMKPRHVHLHDNNGIADDHKALGLGTIDLPAVLPRLPRDVPWIIEVPDLEAYQESVRFLHGKGL